jgi:hypothetical protein
MTLFIANAVRTLHLAKKVWKLRRSSEYRSYISISAFHSPARV